MSFPARQALIRRVSIDDERCTAALFLCANYPLVERKPD
jgi:hypothetical protein